MERRGHQRRSNAPLKIFTGLQPRRHPAVHHLSGAFEPRSLTAIAGPNGAGKSTLLKALMGEIPLAAGAIDRGGLPVRSLG